MENPMSKQPADKFSEGNVHVAIWENEGPKGAFRAATFQLRYKDKDSGEWKTGNSFGPRDLESLEKAAHEAHMRLTKKPAQTQKPAA